MMQIRLQRPVASPPRSELTSVFFFAGIRTQRSEADGPFSSVEQRVHYLY